MTRKGSNNNNTDNGFLARYTYSPFVVCRVRECFGVSV